MLDYAQGQHTLKYDTVKYDFRKLVLNRLLQDESDADLELKDVHQLDGITRNNEKYRQMLFSLFRSEEFQTVYKAFGAELIDTHFDGKGLIQKTPTVRIQLPAAESTSYHSDGWYGHGTSVRSFWVPLTDVCDGNTLYMAGNKSASLACLKNIIASKASLDEINELAQSVCQPFEGGYGDMLTFSSDMIHGAKRNALDYTRVSFDFRIAPNPDDIGSKPISNFFTRQELTDQPIQASTVTSGSSQSLAGITYSNLCGGVSAKSQLMLCAAYCEANDIDIVGNESEIVSLDYMPVMQHYLSTASDAVNCVVVFSTGVFESDKVLAERILDMVKHRNNRLVFCAEGIVFDKDTDKEIILDLI